MARVASRQQTNSGEVAFASRQILTSVANDSLQLLLFAHQVFAYNLGAPQAQQALRGKQRRRVEELLSGSFVKDALSGRIHRLEDAEVQRRRLKEDVRTGRNKSVADLHGPRAIATLRSHGPRHPGHPGHQRGQQGRLGRLRPQHLEQRTVGGYQEEQNVSRKSR